MANRKKEGTRPIVVGIGASAGGLEAIQQFFEKMPLDSGLSFVVIQHLSPDYKSLMDELLARYTRIKIAKAEHNTLVKANTIYLIPPRMNLFLDQGRILLEKQDRGQEINLPIDIFFRSLAGEMGNKAIGVVLSGTGSDGTAGSRAIKEAGGMIMVQDPKSARFDGMPRSSIATGLVDYILSPDEMPSELLQYLQHPFVKQERPLELNEIKLTSSLSRILFQVREHSKVDFSFYKMNTIVRRIQRRMSIIGCNTMDDYYSMLTKSEKEQATLYRELLIGVTSFFREPDSYDLVLKHLGNLIGKEDRKEVRIWSIGCSTGEEAYSLAMMLENYIHRNNMKTELKVFATDLDKNALEIASAGYYSESLTSELESNLRNNYFQRKNQGYQIQDSIRRKVIFAAHNVISDPPFSRIDLISCRNLFIYLKPEIQKQVLSKLYFSLNKGGLLFLGSSETITGLEKAYTTLDAKHKIYKKREGYTVPMSVDLNLSGRKSTLHETGKPSTENALAYGLQEKRNTRLTKILLENLSSPIILIDENHTVLQTYGEIQRYLSIPSGVFTNDLFALLPEELKLIFRSLLRSLHSGREKAFFEYSPRGEDGLIRIEASPISDSGLERKYYYILFTPKEKADTAGCPEKHNLHTNQALNLDYEDLEKELQSTRENLQATVEELETSNEELQASNEELVASNEELQSTNEELQSVNEELYTVNAEYQEKIQELSELNADVNNLLINTKIATIYLDRKLTIRKITPNIPEITNIQHSDINRPLTHIDMTTVYPEFQDDIKQVQRNLLPIEKEARDPSGRWNHIRIMPYRTADQAVDGLIITFNDITSLHASRKEADEQKKTVERQVELLKTVLDNSPTAKTMVDEKGKITYANKTAREIFGLSEKELTERSFKSARWRITDKEGKPIPAKELPFSLIKRTKTSVKNYEHFIERTGQRILLRIQGSPVFSKEHKVEGAVFSIEVIKQEMIDDRNG